MSYFKYFFVFSLLFIILAVIVQIYNVDVSYIILTLKNVINCNRIVNKNNEHNRIKERLFTNDELKDYNGVTKNKLYISILGVVYDVSRSDKHYGPGQSYNIFTGRDASRSFITGNFDSKDATDEVASLDYDELLSLQQWQSFYETEYPRIGKLIGRYYDVDGKPTSYSGVVERLMTQAEKRKDEMKLDEQLYPGCNIEWSAEAGSRVWCTNRSGGVQRNWSGYPRKYYKPGSDSERCACVENYNENNPNMALYENCDINSDSCYVT